jgi:mitochondrial fission protein ELM1
LLVLRDWRPGHYNQAEGVARIVGDHCPVSVDRIEVRQRRLATNHLRRLALSSPWPSTERMLALLYGIRTDRLACPDLVIGAGRPTAAAGILLRRWCGARFVYSGYLRDYDSAEIDLMLVRTLRHAGLPSQVVTPVPSAVSPDAWPPPRRAAATPDLQGMRASLLLGGKGPGYRYDPDEWRRVAALVEGTTMRYGLKWSVASSRRTPDLAADLFAGLAARGIVDFVDFRSAGPGSVNMLFGADLIAVTEDSITMMAEALAARRPVIALRPANVGPRAPADEIAAMAEGGGLAALPIEAATPERFAETLLAIEPAAQDPREALRAVLAPLVRAIQARQEGAPS